VFAGHKVQDTLPSVSLYVPAAHSIHVADVFCVLLDVWDVLDVLDVLEKPGEHMHCSALLALEYLCVPDPGGHCVQFRVSRDRKKPAGHPTHVKGSKFAGTGVVNGAGVVVSKGELVSGGVSGGVVSEGVVSWGVVSVGGGAVVSVEGGGVVS
jgi:hypothetical protein